MDDAVICAIVLHEDKVLDEWIQYHKALGFRAIYLYDNSPDNTLKDWPNKYPKLIVVHLPGKVMQLTAYNHYLENFSMRHTWCAFIDADEFIVLKKHPNIVSLLQEHCKEGALTLNWYMFGSAGKLYYEPEPVTKRFQYRAEHIDKHIKTIARTACVLRMGIHECYMMAPYSGFPHDTNGKIVTGPYNPNGPTDVAVIHHYNAKSYEEYSWKVARGRADNGDTRTMDQFQDADRNANAVIDTSAWDYYQQNVLNAKASTNNTKID